MAFDSAPSSRCKPNCSICPAGSRCFTGGVSMEALNQWNDAVQTHMPVFPGNGALFSAGDVAENLYLVRAGCIKTYTVDQDGNERIRGFHLPGDLVGLDALARDRHPCGAAAVEPSQVCVIPRARVAALATKSPILLQRLLQRTSHELSAALSLSGDYTAEQRVAAFVLSMASRLGGASDRVRLPMTRRDIGNYLRLATETVCRVITRLEHQGVLESRDKTLTVRDHARLTELAEPVGLSSISSDWAIAA
ncbi:cyclic nucleotide-binding domain-containing protein [Sinimarinibacterium sp. CAU 1509]|uniref:cyclic nucleotide-binding domain-containing protein n=1 Tax=Sinimarinibacterium sp. CAU 1509 TaxID=2562283 RepID=UPI0010ACA032|nr:cyclic nucleotide-binding domain-containing protein [Sinimarinibacterium sp. CAU 1509]TJY62989.1 cyclic nucleotide-binding domain-containing protein [Sinimarinibacterium sp. CAU 1509]